MAAGIVAGGIIFLFISPPLGLVIAFLIIIPAVMIILAMAPPIPWKEEAGHAGMGIFMLFFAPIATVMGHHPASVV